MFEHLSRGSAIAVAFHEPPPVRRPASADTDQEPSRRAPSGSAVRRCR